MLGEAASEKSFASIIPIISQEGVRMKVFLWIDFHRQPI